MKPKNKSTFDPANIASLIPGQVDEQKDSMGRPIKIGDRVDDCCDYISGVVVAVFGEQCVFVTDSDGALGIGRFCNQNCKDVRLLPPVTDVNALVADLLAYRATLDKDLPSRPAYVPNIGQPIGLTHIDADKAVDVGGRPIRPGDNVIGTEEVVSGGFPHAGNVVAVAGTHMLIRFHDSDGDVRYDGVETGRYIVQPKGGV